MPSLTQMYLPDPLDNFPWPRRENPHAAEVGPQAMQWIRTLVPFDKRREKIYEVTAIREYHCRTRVLPVYHLLTNTQPPCYAALICSLCYCTLGKGKFGLAFASTSPHVPMLRPQMSTA